MHSKIENKPLILIVDDDEDARDILEQFLANNGYRTALAENGKEAIIEWERLAPDLILMDANMPVMDGMQACAEIHQRTKKKTDANPDGNCHGQC